MAERRKASKFRAEFKQYCEHYGGVHVHNLIDAYNTHKKPYDSFYVRRGRFVAIEFKEVKGLSIRGDIVTDHQMNGLLDASNSGKRSRGLIVVFFSRKEFLKELFVCSVESWVKLFSGDPSKGVWKWKNPSLKIEQIKEEGMFGKFINRRKNQVIGKTLWDFNSWQQYILLKEKCNGQS